MVFKKKKNNDTASQFIFFVGNHLFTWRWRLNLAIASLMKCRQAAHQHTLTQTSITVITVSALLTSPPLLCYFDQIKGAL